MATAKLINRRRADPAACFISSGVFDLRHASISSLVGQWSQTFNFGNQKCFGICVCALLSQAKPQRSQPKPHRPHRPHSQTTEATQATQATQQNHTGLTAKPHSQKRKTTQASHRLRGSNTATPQPHSKLHFDAPHLI